MTIKNLLLDTNIVRVELPKHTILEELEALLIEIDKQGWGHYTRTWKPISNILTQRDPYCSSLALKEKALTSYYLIIKETLRTQINA